MLYTYLTMGQKVFFIYSNISISKYCRHLQIILNYVLLVFAPQQLEADLYKVPENRVLLRLLCQPNTSHPGEKCMNNLSVIYCS